MAAEKSAMNLIQLSKAAEKSAMKVIQPSMAAEKSGLELIHPSIAYFARLQLVCLIALRFMKMNNTPFINTCKVTRNRKNGVHKSSLIFLKTFFAYVTITNRKVSIACQNPSVSLCEFFYANNFEQH
jgi:hypothetical protein